MAKILVVDDVATELELMRQAVSRLGHTTVVASDGEAAIEIARKEQPQLILLDVVLPKMDGYRACRMLKKDPVTAHIPVVMVTSKNLDSDRFWGEKQGADGYLGKPVSADELAATADKFLTGK